MSGEENLNASIESLEYEITDALRRLNNTNDESVAFIEGHNEFAEQDVMSITKALSAYYNVDRGVLGTDASVLDKYKAVIIADPSLNIRKSADVNSQKLSTIPDEYRQIPTNNDKSRRKGAKDHVKRYFSAAFPRAAQGAV